MVDGSVAAGAGGWRIPAGEIETAVARGLAARLRHPKVLSAVLRSAGAAADTATRLLARLAALPTGSPRRPGRLTGAAPAAGQFAARDREIQLMPTTAMCRLCSTKRWRPRALP
jgi:hypothetical protein